MNRLASLIPWALAASTAQAAVVLPDSCQAHPTPPPRHYVDRAVQYQRDGYAVVTVRVVPRDDVDRACQRASGVGEPIGFPGTRFGACTIMDVARLPFTALIIIPATGRDGALCHELGHVGGWPWDHPDR